MARCNANFTTTFEGKNYLLCDGNTYDIAKYPELYRVLGTNVLPNLIDRVLWGSMTGGTYLEAGLPNITGTFSAKAHAYKIGNVTGAFRALELGTGAPNTGTDEQPHYWEFNASYSNNIYGNSTTVQPPAMTVRYYIRAK